MRTIKLVIIGDSGVGKTSLRNQYILGRFSTGYRATIGTDFIIKTLPHYQNPEEFVTLQIWDTAGQERFSSLSTAFFRGADAALLMFDVNRPQTLSSLSKWWAEFKAHAPVPDEEAEDFCCVVVGNKIDLAEVEEMHSEPIESGNGNERMHERVSEAEAESFLEQLVPRMSTAPDEDDYEYCYGENDDPFIVTTDDQDQSRRTTGFFMRRSISSFSLQSIMHSRSEPVEEDEHISPSRPRTQSISIQASGSYKHPFRKRFQKSRSSERSQLGGTMTTTHTTQTIYHTPASSLFDAFESAPSSPSHVDHDFLPSPVSTAGTTATFSARVPRRMASTSSISSAPTITPSLFVRTQASASTSAAPTPPTPIECSTTSDFPFSPATKTQVRRRGPPLPPRPERRPRLFLTSAKTGAGVEPVFEHIARRVAMRWVYAEALETRDLHSHEQSGMTTDTLRLGLARSSSESGMVRLRDKITKGTSCCGS